MTFQPWKYEIMRRKKRRISWFCPSLSNHPVTHTWSLQSTWGRRKLVYLENKNPHKQGENTQSARNWTTNERVCFWLTAQPPAWNKIDCRWQDFYTAGSVLGAERIWASSPFMFCLCCCCCLNSSQTQKCNEGRKKKKNQSLEKLTCNLLMLRPPISPPKCAPLPKKKKEKERKKGDEVSNIFFGGLQLSLALFALGEQR